MKNFKKPLLLGLVGIAMIGCTPKNAYSVDPLVKNVKNLGYVTGKEAFYDTTEFNLGSCDLGFPAYIDETNEMYFFFGDSFSGNNQSGTWRSNVAGISSDFNFKDGLTIDNVLRKKNGMIAPIFEGHHSDDGYYERTTIPTGAIFVNGTLYMYFFSMFDWSASSDTRMNYGGLVKSTDLGATWTRLNEMSWVNRSPDMKKGSKNNNESIEKLINEDIYNVPAEKNTVKVADHCGWDATQIYPMDGKDGYIYLFLEGGYRNHPLKLARVLAANIEKWDEYEYMQGYDNAGNPTYIKGYEGLKGIYNNNNAQITTYNFGEMSGLYNPYLKKWCLLTVTTGGVRMVMSDHIWGPYNETAVLFVPGDEVSPMVDGKPYGVAYAPMTHEKMLTNKGKVMYMLVSSWIPCYNPCLFEVSFN